ncbi:MAG: S8 family serine peptidase [Clostridia bacterium]|nr:S8 family serine peptidase [Clostridia bacterium]
MRKFISVILSVIIFSSTLIFGIKKPLIAKAEENAIQSFINETVELIKENDDDKVFVAENEEKIETASYALSVDETEDTTFQTCRLIVKSDTTPDKLNSIGTASGFSDYHIIQFENEEDTKNAFDFYSECDYVEDVFCDRVFDASSDYTVDQSNQITYQEEVPERLDSWGSQVTGMYDLKDYIKSNCNLTELPQIKVAVIDSGVDLNHEFLKGRLIETGFNNSGYGDENSEHETFRGHGTMVSSVIADNTLDNVKLLVYKVVNSQGTTTIATIISAILEAASKGANYINMSVGCSSSSEAEKKLLDATLEQVHEMNSLIIAASGNNGRNIDYYNDLPGACSRTVAVAASNMYNLPTSWSNQGDSVSVMAPGEDIHVASPNDKYELTSGTSFSSPLTLSLYALLKTLYPSENNEQLKVRIEGTADESDLEGIVNMYGYGIIDAIGAAGLKRTESPIINNKNEIYEGIAEIEITVPENTVVYYTMDQTYPSKENGVLYDEKSPIVIEDDFFLIHAVAYSKDGFRSDYVSDLVRAATPGTDDMFDIDENGIVTNYYGNVNYLKIPDTIKGVAVTGFTEKLFSDAVFHAVCFSDGITSISTNLFYGNTTIQYADGNGITDIQAGAFYNCRNLYKINFPKVISIGKEAFYSTRQLSGIGFDYCTYIDQYAFYNSIIRYANLPSVETICAYAFNKCECLYGFYAPNLIEFRERIYMSGQWQGGGHVFVESGLNCIMDFENITELPYGCFYQARVKRLEFSNVKIIDTLPITYCKTPYYGTITVVLPSTLESCALDMIPYYEKESDYNMKYKVYCSEGTYAQQWAIDNGYDYEIVTSDNAIITDLPEYYYSYMRPLEADVVGFNRTYQWYGSETPNYNGIAITGATERKFNPDIFTREYKYYYCVVTSTDVGYDPIEIKTGICENKTYNPYNPPKSNGKVTIATPSTRYLKYGESINLYANATGLPEGSKIKWRIVEGIGVTLDPSVSGKICTVTSKSNGDVTIEAYAVNKNGNTIVNESGNRICDREGISSEVSLWLFIIYHIRMIFKTTKNAVNILI